MSSFSVCTVKQLLGCFLHCDFPWFDIRCLTWFSCWCHKQICRSCSSPWRWCLRNLSSCRLLSWSISRRLSIFKQLLWAPWISSAFAFGPSLLNSSMNWVRSWLLFRRASDFSKSSARAEFHQEKPPECFVILVPYFKYYSSMLQTSICVHEHNVISCIAWVLTLEDKYIQRYFNLDSSYVTLQRYNGVYTNINIYRDMYNGVLRDVKTKTRSVAVFSKLSSFWWFPNLWVSWSGILYPTSRVSTLCSFSPLM